jgi:hypothetical protein
MICPACRVRKAKRACPALGQSICPTCCATKRLKEIACPADCHYLASAHAHPPAAVQRQRERDLPLLVRMIEGLTDGQARLVGILQHQLRDYRATAIPPLRDADVEEASRALAATLETAARGIVYDHQPASLPAQRLLQLFELTCEELARQDRTLRPAVLATVLRRFESAARDAARALQQEAGPAVFLDFLDRTSGGRPRGAATGLIGGLDEPGAHAPDDGPRLIIP